MTTEEYRSMEAQAIVALQELRENGINGNDIGILMSHEVYDMAKYGDNSAYAVSGENFRAVYWGYDVYIISENAPLTFSPVLIRFSENDDLHRLDAGTLLISESDDGTLQVYAKSIQEPEFFCKTEFTAYQAYQAERVTFTDRYDWVDFFPDVRLQSDLLRFTTLL